MSVFLLNRWHFHPVVSGEGDRHAGRSGASVRLRLHDWPAGTFLSRKVRRSNFVFSYNIMTCHLPDKICVILRTYSCVSTPIVLCSPAAEEEYLCARWPDWTGDWSMCCFTPSCSRRWTSLTRTNLVRGRSNHCYLCFRDAVTFCGHNTFLHKLFFQEVNCIAESNAKIRALIFCHKGL